jgi:hypothetical protein
MKKTLATRAIDRGLAKVEPTSPNTLIAYSAKAGSTALDGNSTNSPFTLALSKHLTTPGLDVRRAFGFVRDDVLKSTSNRQEPFVYGSLGGEDVALVPGPAKAVAAEPAPNPQAEARRDYELALQIGNKDALNVFLAQYPDGFYANLARLQLGKIQAEETQVAATDKAKKAEQERARLAATAAPNAPQVQAAEADAKAAEKARLDAEKAKQVAANQAAEAEKKRVAMTDPAARSNNATVANNSPAPMANSAPVAPAAANSPAVQPAQPDLVAALTQPPASNNQPAVATATPAPTPAADVPKPTEMASLSQGPPAQNDLDKSVQLELRRVGCLNAPADGEWNTETRRSLSLFNRSAGTKLDVKVASIDTLDAIKSKEGRVCPVVCDHGFRAKGDHCTKIVCADNWFLNDDNECEKRSGKTPTAKREIQREHERETERNRDRENERNRETSRDRRENYRDERAVERPGPDYGAPPPRVSSRGVGSTGQIVCGVSGCHAVAKGCHIEFKTTAQGGPIEGGGGNVQVCN